jgi:hypothetical protein
VLHAHDAGQGNPTVAQQPLSDLRFSENQGTRLEWTAGAGLGCSQLTGRHSSASPLCSLVPVCCGTLAPRSWPSSLLKPLQRDAPTERGSVDNRAHVQARIGQQGSGTLFGYIMHCTAPLSRHCSCCCAAAG